MNHFSSKLLVFFLVSLNLFLNANWLAKAQFGAFILEAEQHWDTYGVGGTCIGGGHNLAIVDLNGDGVSEILTGGSAYNLLPDGSRTARWAPMKLWNWNGGSLTLEENQSWAGNIGSVYAGDADGDGTKELITTGNVTKGAVNTPSIRIWSLDGKMLFLKGFYEGQIAGSVSIGDVDGDGKPEIAAVTGRISGIAKDAAQLSLFDWDGENLSLAASVYSSDASSARTHSVCADDLDNDGVAEIVTAGYSNALNNSHGQVRIWQFDGNKLTLRISTEWSLIDGAYSEDVAGNVLGNTIVNKAKVSDVDDDGFREIITGGFTYDGNRVKAQLRIWNWSGNSLNLEKSHEWENLDITQVSSVAVDDVDGDGEKEIVTSGGAAVYGSFAQNATEKERAELRVWSWNRNVLSLEQGLDWTVGEGVSAWNVGTADVDNDGTTEIVTVGCMYTGIMCDPDLRVWSLVSTAEPAAVSNIYLLAGIIAALVFGIVVSLLIVRRK